MVLLVHPPVAKPCEPPGGLLQLAGVLAAEGVSYSIWDASLEGLLYLIKSALREGNDTWTKRAFAERLLHLNSLRDLSTYAHPARYRRAVADLTRVLDTEGSKYGVKISLSDYRDPTCLPVSSRDLLRAAENPQITPFYSYYKERLDGMFNEAEPQIVGISLNFLSQAVNAFALAGLIRKLMPSVRIVLGGSLVTSWARKLAGENPFRGLIDDLVFGPGEGPLLEMLGKKRPVRDTGLSLQGFPIDDYLSPEPVFPIALSQGCYYGRCMFCPERSEGRKYKALGFSEMAERIFSLIEGRKLGLIHFLDSALSPPLLKRIMELSFGRKWYGFTRITEELTDEFFCRALRESGCVMLKLGVESGSQVVLDSLQKGTNLFTISRALRTLKKVGIATYIYLLFGTPEEGEREARETMQFVIEHAHHITYLNAAIFNLPVGSRSDLRCRPFYPGDLSLYEDFDHPRGWDRRKVRLFLARDFRISKPIREILLRTPPVFTSNHAPFFTF